VRARCFIFFWSFWSPSPGWGLVRSIPVIIEEFSTSFNMLPCIDTYPMVASHHHHLGKIIGRRNGMKLQWRKTEKKKAWSGIVLLVLTFAKQLGLEEWFANFSLSPLRYASNTNCARQSN
jgi:hypothetical protein